MNIGTLIRKHRKDRKLTLKAVAEKAGISEGFLSQVENNVNSPSVVTLMNICNSIGVNAGDLLNQIERQEKLVVIRRGELEDIDIPHTGFVTRRFFSPEYRTAIDSAVLIIAPGKSIPVRKDVRNGQEVLCVLEGSVDLIHGEETVNLAEGDAVQYLADIQSQMVSNNGKTNAVVLWVGTM